MAFFGKKLDIFFIKLQVNQMTPQVINAGKIRLNNSGDNADKHFENLRSEYSDALNRLRSFVDDAIDTGDFVRASEGVCFLILWQKMLTYGAKVF